MNLPAIVTATFWISAVTWGALAAAVWSVKDGASWNLLRVQITCMFLATAGGLPLVAAVQPAFIEQHHAAYTLVVATRLGAAVASCALSWILYRDLRARGRRRDD